MYTAGVILLGLVVLTLAVTLGVLYWHYQSWPPLLWKVRVQRWFAALQEQREQAQATTRTGDKLAALFEDHFGRYLRTIPLEALDKYPGIGPATIARLRDAGFRDLGSVMNLRFEAIPGFGPTRALDLVNAVRALVREARSRFEAGACPEAQEYRRQAETLRMAEREETGARERKLAAIDAALVESRHLQELAQGITFWTYLFHRASPGVTTETMNHLLPVVVLEAPAPASPVAPVVAIPPPVPVTAVAVAKSANDPAPALAVTEPAAPVPVASGATHPWLPRMRAYARFGFVVAKADGRVAQSERKVIRAFLAAQFGHQESLARQIDPMMEQVEAAIPTEADVLAELRTVTTEAERRELYPFAEQIADAAGERKEREREALERIAHAFGIVPAPLPSPTRPPETVAAPTVAPEPAVDSRALLEIAPGTELTPELIRRRFAMLTSKLDPAKAREMGPEFGRMAEEKVTRLRSAALELIAPFNEPLEQPVAAPPADPRHNPDLDDVFGG